MQDDATLARFTSIARDRYSAAHQKRVRSFARAVGDPYRAARNQGKTAHPVWSRAIHDLADQEIDDRVDLLVKTISDVLSETQPTLSADDLARSFDDVAGEVVGGAHPCGSDPPSIFSDVCPSVEGAARNLGVWPTTEAGQQAMRDLRQYELDALNGGRATVRGFAARTPPRQGEPSIHIDNRGANYVDNRGGNIARDVAQARGNASITTTPRRGLLERAAAIATVLSFLLAAAIAFGVLHFRTASSPTVKVPPAVPRSTPNTARSIPYNRTRPT